MRIASDKLCFSKMQPMRDLWCVHSPTCFDHLDRSRSSGQLRCWCQGACAPLRESLMHDMLMCEAKHPYCYLAAANSE